MKIFSEMMERENHRGELEPTFVLYLDTQRTGDPSKDSLYCANDFTNVQGTNDPEVILALLIPMISELVYTAYGDSIVDKKPMTDWHATGFDPKYPNGVNTGVYDKK